jgi:hypothetical protein
MTAGVFTLNAEHRQQLILALESAALECGMDLYHFSVILIGFIDKHRPNLEAFRSRETIDAFFAKVPDEDDEEVRIYVGIFLVLPKLLQQAVQSHIKTIAQSFPPDRPGPPRKLTKELSSALVDFIYVLDRKRVPRRIAQERAALHFNIGLRTVQRAWRERLTDEEQPPTTLSEIWKFFEQA